MITFTGVQMHPGCGRSPQPMDIAVGMCRITRYAGAIWCPLAAHSILVGEFCANLMANADPVEWPDLVAPNLAFAFGLLHDAHETVTGELTRHYKPPEMKSFEAELDAVIFSSMNLSREVYLSIRKLVKTADELALVVEATMLSLNGWPAYYRMMEGCEPPKVDPVVMQLGADILERWSNERMVRAGSREIATLNNALQNVQSGNYDAARAALIDFE